MPIKILMPALSPTMEHGNLAKWIKKEGDKISAGEVIAEIETDKATMEVEAVDEGILAKIIVQEGSQAVAVNSLIAVLLEEDEDKSSLEEFIKQNSNNSFVAQPEKKDLLETKHPSDLAKSLITQSSLIEPKNTDRVFASPLAKRIAKNENIDLTLISGTGPRGRIVKADVLSSIDKKGKIIKRHLQEYVLVPNNNMRKIIAKRLTESKQTVPHFYLSIECFMDSILEIRSQINKTFIDDNLKRVSVNDFIILASAKALKDVPEANSSWSENAIMRYNNIDVSVAVAIEGGLITPIIRNADQKDLTIISAEMKDLIKRARVNALKPEEFQGGGFSISNLGMYGIKSFNAIINPPQGCILAVGASNKRTVVIDDKIEIRTIMDVTLSCDHRVVDGAVGAEFLNAFRKYVESPILMFI